MTNPRLFLLFVCMITPIASAQSPSTVTVQVVDELDAPISEAQVTVWYVSFRGEDDYKVSGGTDDNGIFSATGTAPLRIQVAVTKEGYYQSESGRLQRDQDHTLRVQLRERVNPRPMCARKITVQVPSLRNPHGFDLKVGDWIAPHGTGKHADLILRAEKTVRTREDYEGKLTIRFPNPTDGIMEDPNWSPLSGFKSSRTAPIDGYAPSEVIVRSRVPRSGYRNTPKRNYLLRLRTVVDKQGNIISANYGKICGGIESFVGTNHPERFGIQFTYYFNPESNDQNLEFDPERNLFHTLPNMEKVYSP